DELLRERALRLELIERGASPENRQHVLHVLARAGLVERDAHRPRVDTAKVDASGGGRRDDLVGLRLDRQGVAEVLMPEVEPELAQPGGEERGEAVHVLRDG